MLSARFERARMPRRSVVRGRQSCDRTAGPEDSCSLAKSLRIRNDLGLGSCAQKGDAAGGTIREKGRGNDHLVDCLEQEGLLSTGGHF